MAFSRDDLAAMLRLLQEDPALRDALRHQLLSDSQRLIESSIVDLALAQRTTEARLDALAEAMAEGFDTLTDGLTTLTARVDTLAEVATEQARRFDALGEMVAAMTRHLDKLTDWVGELRGDSFERRFREQASTRFAPIARRLRVLTGPPLDDILDDAVEAGGLTEEEAHEVRLADVVVRGRRREDGAEVLLVAEVSAGVGVKDVTRAARRAELLGRLGRQTLAVVAGEFVAPEAVQAARAFGVWQVSATGVQPPPDDPEGALAS